MCSLSVCPDELLLDRLVLLRFTRSLVISVASCNATSFTSCACEDLPSVSIFNEGYNLAVHVSSTVASLMLSRHLSQFLEYLPAGCTRGYASCVHRESSASPQHSLPRAAVSPQHPLPRAAVLLNTHFHVLRAQHAPSARCACRALSPQLDCSGRCLAKRLHEPCCHEHCTNSTPVKLLITRFNSVRSLSHLNRIELILRDLVFIRGHCGADFLLNTVRPLVTVSFASHLRYTDFC